MNPEGYRLDSPKTNGVANHEKQTNGVVENGHWKLINNDLKCLYKVGDSVTV